MAKKGSRVIEIYDTTCRDGTEAEDIAFSIEDKIRVAKKLDELGIQYIEAGWPGSNPKLENIIEASWQALTDSINYKLLKNQTG